MVLVEDETFLGCGLDGSLPSWLLLTRVHVGHFLLLCFKCLLAVNDLAGSDVVRVTSMSLSQEKAAVQMWQSYLAVTAPLSQQLCEQLRLILEPTQAAKLK